MSTADAVAREAAWLATSGDGLPALLSSADGPWNIVQAYWPRTPNTSKSGIYVLRARLDDERFENVTIKPQYGFRLKLVWPIRNTSGSGGQGLAETAQQAFDDAIDLLVQRVRGFAGDKTHGGRFLSVGEAPRGQHPHIDWTDPEQTISGNTISLHAEMTYPADDPEVYG